VSLMGAFVKGVLHLCFQCILFPSPSIGINQLIVQNLGYSLFVNRLAWGVVQQGHLKLEVHIVPYERKERDIA
jgi:hypothetical protein